jgi:hypothetical protein
MGRVARVVVPRRIKIRGRWWRVQRSTRLGKGVWGDANPETRVIRLSSHLKGRDLGLTLIHEVLHACLPDSAGDVLRIEEALVRRLERPLKAVMESGALIKAVG